MLLDRETTFASFDFGLDRRLVKAVARMSFVYPTLVQSKAIPLALEGKDLLVRARTGSGKTAAFSLPLLHKILLKKQAASRSKPGVLAVVLVPTKELCDQTYRAMVDLTYYCKDVISVQALMGDNMSAQQALLRDQPEVVIATPARLLAHLRADNVKLKDSVETLVIDEADLVLSFGYDEDVRAVVAQLPRIYQGLLMSATLSPELDDLKRVVLHSPAILKLEEGRSDGQLLQFYATLPEDDKYLLVYVFLKLGVLEGKGLFFVNSLDSCYRLKLFLEQFHIRAAVLNAELPLNSRLHTLQEFNRGIFDYLIATDESMDACGGESDSEDSSGEEEEEEEEEDMDEGSEEEDDDDDDEEEDEEEEEEEEGAKAKGKAKGKDTPAKKDSSKAPPPPQQQQQQQKRGDAEYGVSRGVDFKAVNFVVNVDCPPTVRSYTHRVGRTARGGANGTALTLVKQGSASEMALLQEVQASQPALPPMEGDPMLTSGPASEGYDGSTAGGASHLRAQPAPLAFDLKEMEGFRYRVQDVKRSVTRMCVKEARLAEIKQELINSEALKGHFENNPQEFQILRHDKGLLPSNRIKEHLKHVPDYLLPKGMRVGEDPSLKKRKRRRGGRKRALGHGSERSRRKDKDPLQSFEEGGGQEAEQGGSEGEGEDVEDPLDDDEGDAGKDRVYHTGEELGQSAAGRQQWKMAHKKGKYSSKPKREKKKFRRG